MPQAILSSEHGSLNPQQLRKRQSNWTALIASHLLLPVIGTAKRAQRGGRGDAGYRPGEKDPLTPYLVNVKQTDLEPGNIMSSSVNSLPHSWASIAVINPRDGAICQPVHADGAYSK